MVFLKHGTITFRLQEAAHLVMQTFKAKTTRCLPSIVKYLSTEKHQNESIKSFLLEYKYVEGMAEKRIPIRAAHLTYAKKYVDEQKLIAGGAILPEIESGMLIFKCSKPEVEKFASEDPYVLTGLVTRYDIKEWNIAVGRI